MPEKNDDACTVEIGPALDSLVQSMEKIATGLHMQGVARLYAAGLITPAEARYLLGVGPESEYRKQRKVDLARHIKSSGRDVPIYWCDYWPGKNEPAEEEDLGIDLMGGAQL